jgi:tetratricopeptide (TPR) repeat protein
MLIHAPGLIPAKRNVNHLTRIIDLAPTLLDYLNVNRSFGQGTSLRSLIDGRPPKDDIVAYSESLYPSLNLGWSELRGLESGKHRFILAPSPELYDLDEDPDERNNVIASRQEIAAQLRTELEMMVGAEDSHSAQTIDPATETMLRRLGYISGSRSPSKTSSVDPKEKMELWNQIQLGIFQFGARDYRSALGTFTRILESEESLPMVYEYLGSCHMKLDQFSQAEQVYRKALERGMDSAAFHLNLGLIHSHRREWTEAERELRSALSLEARNVSAHYRLADVYRAAKNTDGAMAHYREALEINPSYVYAWNGLGMTLAAVRRNGEALTAFRKVVAIDPQGARGYFNLAVLLERMGRGHEALETYQKFMDLSQESEFSRERKRAQEALIKLKK